MNTLQPLTLLAAAILAFSACSTNEEYGGAPGTDHSVPTGTVATEDRARHNNADTEFAQGMIRHHQMAVKMSDLMLSKSEVDPKVIALATRIKEAQTPEIEKLKTWLSTWGETMGMDAMAMSEEDMAALASATGADADKMFLTMMIEHHQKAVAMARTEMSRGSNPDAITMASGIVSAQEAEITEMKALIATIPGT